MNRPLLLAFLVSLAVFTASESGLEAAPTLPAQTPADPDRILKAGEPIPYTIRVINGGPVSQTGIKVIDPVCNTPPAYASGDNGNGILDASETWLYSCLHFVTQAELDRGVIENTAIVSSDQTSTTSPTVSLSLSQRPALSATHTADLTQVDKAGETITYVTRVENTGNITLGTPVASSLFCDAPPVYDSGDDGDGLLEVSEGWLYKCSHRVTQADLDSNGGGDGELDSVAEAATSRASAESERVAISVVRRPALSVTQTSNLSQVEEAGETITFAIRIQNTGNVSLSGIIVNEPGCDEPPAYRSGDNGDRLLDVSEAWLFICLHTVTQEEVDSNGGDDGEINSRADVTSTVDPSTVLASADAAVRIAPLQEVVRSVTRPDFVKSIRSLQDIETAPAAIGTNLFLATAILLLILLSATVFNEVIEENSDNILALFGPVLVQFKALSGALGGASNGSDGQENRFLQFARWPFIIGIGGLIYTLLEPGVGFNGESLVLFGAMVAAILVTTVVYDGGKILAAKGLGQPMAVRLFPIAILIAALSVLVSKVTDVNPGIVYGFVAAARFLPTARATESQHGIVAYFPLLLLFLTSIVAWILLSVLRPLSEEGNASAAFAEGVAATVFISGLQGALFNLTPLTFVDGRWVWQWNRIAWASLAIPGVFLLFHVMLNDEGDLRTAMESSGIRGLVVLCASLWLATGAVWWYFRTKNREAAQA